MSNNEPLTTPKLPLVATASTITHSDHDIGDKTEHFCGQEAREAYFQALRTWLAQVRLAHNAAATFPYYLMANYPQLLASTAHFNNINNAATAVAARPAQNAVADEVPLRFGMIRMRQQELLDNPARMAESKYYDGKKYWYTLRSYNMSLF